MNKKRLSVVMAGAMLASSVAPVLAATANHANDTWELDDTTGKKYTVNGSNRGTLVKELRNLLLSKVYADVKENEEVKVSSGTVDVRNTSVYEVQINGTVYNQVTEAGIKAMEDAVNNAAAGVVITVIDRGAVKVGTKYYVATQEASKVETEVTYSNKKELEDTVTWFKNNKAKAPAVESMEMNGDVLVVTTRIATDELNLKTIELKVGDKKLEFKEPIDADGKILSGRTDSSDWSDLAGFNTYKTTVNIPKGSPIDGKVLAEVTVSDVDSEVVVKLSDLYDGLLLTNKGQDLLAALKEFPENGTLKVGHVASLLTDSKNGIFTFGIEFETYSADKNGDPDKLIEKNLVTVSSNNKAQLELFRGWMENRTPLVDVLAGDNRYETAVKVAKENAHIKDVAKNGNIVLVNGNALVDGLAAAPLAAAAWNKNHGPNSDSKPALDKQRVAPILLTESDSLPKATKEYIKELIAEQKVGQLGKVTIYLVGGETVISKSLENQLKEYGLRVVRAGGDNREETSLKVAEVILKDGLEENVDIANPFIVGAEGEADAMSIAPVAAGAAARTNKRIRPIIVESKKGLSEDALDTIKDWKNDKYDTKAISATIVGGENVVSKETEALLKANDVVIDRVSGSNRQATNAAVIDRYYGNASVKKLVVSKDGQNKKSELIDALTATSLAVKDNAPIVLGTKKLSNAQIETLEQKATRTGLYVYQVGHGVARDVLKTIADRVGLAK